VSSARGVGPAEAGRRHRHPAGGLRTRSSARGRRRPRGGAAARPDASGADAPARILPSPGRSPRDQGLPDAGRRPLPRGARPGEAGAV